MLQNSFLQHLLLLFHKEKKSQALRGKEPTKFRHLSKTQKHTAIFPLWNIIYFFSLSTLCRLFLLLSSRSTACFVENDVLFYWKRRVVFWRERKSCETYGKTEKQNEVKIQIVLGVCDTCDSKKWEIPVMRDRAYTRMCARTSASLIFQFDVHRLYFLEGNPFVFSIY